MMLYHGSYAEVSTPDLKHSRLNVDFGRGFYTTSIYGQAVKWCPITDLMREHLKNFKC